MPGAFTEADDPRLLLLSPADNVFVAREPIPDGAELLIGGGRYPSPAIGRGHKIARKAIAAGEKVLKYGAPIGSATRDIPPGEHVHLHNMKSDYTQSHVIDASAGEKAQ